jgi:hypothetical protein
MKSYYSIIPAPIRESDLTPRAKLLFGEIVALTHSTGKCWATNEYFATMFKVSTRTIQRELNQMIKAGFLSISYDKRGVRQICHTMTRMSWGYDKSVVGGMTNLSPLDIIILIRIIQLK